MGIVLHRPYGAQTEDVVGRPVGSPREAILPRREVPRPAARGGATWFSGMPTMTTPQTT